MKKIFHAHPDIIITALAILFVAALVSFYSWAINDIYNGVHQSFVTPAPSGADTFNLQGASQLDLHGIAPGTSPAAPVLEPPAPPPFAK